MERLSQLTTGDLVRAGACVKGVLRFAKRHNYPAAMDTDIVVKLCNRHEIGYVLKAGNLDSYGDGYGYGYGDGDGDGYGDGYGYGYGYGDGYGDGYGYGYGGWEL